MLSKAPRVPLPSIPSPVHKKTPWWVFVVVLLSWPIAGWIEYKDYTTTKRKRF